MSDQPGSEVERQPETASSDALKPEIVGGNEYQLHREEFQNQQAFGIEAGVDATAVTALVLAISSFFVLPILPAIIAVSITPGAKRRIRDSGGRLQGLGLAKAAQILGWLNIVVCVVFAYFIVQLVQWAFNAIS